MRMAAAAGINLHILEISKGKESYKNKGEPVGITPDYLFDTAADFVFSWIFLPSLIFLVFDILVYLV